MVNLFAMGRAGAVDSLIQVHTLAGSGVAAVPRRLVCGLT